MIATMESIANQRIATNEETGEIIKSLCVPYTDDLVHVGFCTGKPRPHLGHEGPLFSCSNCPEDWQAIAQLGGAPSWHVLPRNRDGFLLLGMHEIPPELVRSLMLVAQARGLVQPHTVFKAFQTLEDDLAFSLHLTQEEALSESSEGEVEAYPGWNSTPTLNQFWRGEPGIQVGLFHVLDAAIAYLGQDCACVDGLLWDDLYDPAALSAPRVGLFPNRIFRIYRRRRVVQLGPIASPQTT